MGISPRRQASSLAAIAAATSESAGFADSTGRMSAPTASKMRPKLSSTSATQRGADPREQRLQPQGKITKIL